MNGKKIENVLELVKMGCDFRTDEKRESDCQNYRLRANNITTKDGENIGADFGFWGNSFPFLRCEAWKKIVNKNYYFYTAYPLLENFANDKLYRTTDILDIINKISKIQYQSVKIIEN